MLIKPDIDIVDVIKKTFAARMIMIQENTSLSDPIHPKKQIPQPCEGPDGKD